MHAFRSLFRRPFFALITIGTIAIALGATTAVFSIVNGALLKPLPFRNPDQLVYLQTKSHSGFEISVSLPNYRDLRDRSRSFANTVGITGWNLKLTGRGPAEVLSSQAIHGDLFGTMGLETAIGRGFTARETPDHPGGPFVVVLGYSYWKTRFGGDPGILGQTLTLDGRNYSVIGVLSPGTGFPTPEVQAYFPLATLGDDVPWDDRDSGFGTDALARLRPDVAPAAATLDLGRVNREFKTDFGEATVSFELSRLDDWYLGRNRTQLWILLGAVGFVLLIAVANVGNLLLTRGEERYRELAVRTALGAARGRLVSLLLGEAMLIAVIGGLLGTALAVLAVKAVVPTLPTEIPSIVRSQIRVDTTVLIAGLGLTLFSGLLFGLVPSLRSSRVNLASSMTGSRTTGGEHHRLRAALVVAEISLALILMVGAGLTLKSLSKLGRVDKGFDQHNVLTAAIAASEDRVNAPVKWREFYDAVRERMAALPGVRSSAATLLLPLSNRSWELRVHPEGIPVEKANGQSVLFNIVSPEYFETIGVSIIRGRGFTLADREGSVPVAIIDETMARRFWPGDDPLGKRITLQETTGTPPVPMYRTVVGVVKNLRHYELTNPSRIQAYIPLDQAGGRYGITLRVALRTDGDPRRLALPLRQAVTELDGDATVSQLRTLEENVDRASAGSRALTRLLTGFGAAALGLAGLGIFGVVSYSVTRRTREIGIRMALGADSRRVLRWVGAGTLPMILLGVVIGTALAAGLSRLLRNALFEVSPLDLPTFAAGCAVLILAAVLATWLPARRASRVDPARVMREEG